MRVGLWTLVENTLCLRQLMWELIKEREKTIFFDVSLISMAACDRRMANARGLTECVIREHWELTQYMLKRILNMQPPPQIRNPLSGVRFCDEVESALLKGMQQKEHFSWSRMWASITYFFDNAVFLRQISNSSWTEILLKNASKLPFIMNVMCTIYIYSLGSVKFLTKT